MRQVDAVIEAVMKVKPDFKQHSDKGNEIIIDDIRKQVCEIVTEGILNGDIDYNKDEKNIKEVKSYVPGMVSNWLRRNKVLNGDVNAKAAKPGSRLGVGDEELKTLRDLRKTQVEPEILAEVDKYIKARLSMLKKEKQVVKQADINIDALPKHLKNKLKL
jgi:hypothetical protein